MELVIAVYNATATLPRTELFGLTSQMRRAAVSVPSNIAEGQGRHSRRDYCRFLYHARGSLLGVETQVILAARLDYLSRESATDLFKAARRTGRPLNGLIRHLERLLEETPTPDP